MSVVPTPGRKLAEKKAAGQVSAFFPMKKGEEVNKHFK
jgi:hypothetical protein